MQALLSRAKERPEGYLEHVLSLAQVDGDKVSLSDRDYVRLRQQYNPPTPWPNTVFGLAMRAVRQQAISGELGVGDTIARIIGPIGGAAYKRWFQTKFGRSCGCSERQAELNRQYPYL